MAADLGCTPAQAMIAWARTRSQAIHPILGARHLSQLTGNLGALDISLPAEAGARLEAAAAFDPGFPAAFIRDNTPWVSVPQLSRGKDCADHAGCSRFLRRLRPEDKATASCARGGLTATLKVTGQTGPHG